MEIKEFLNFLKKPRYTEDPDASLSYRIRFTTVLLLVSLALSLGLAMMLGVLGAVGPWNIEEHAFDELFNTYSPMTILLLASLVAPALEELLFRGPMWFFRDSKYFPILFYASTLAFALVHLGNFPNFAEIWPVSPLLISPQFALGLFLGFVRVRFGLLWSIGFHSAYNTIVLAPLLLLNQLGIPLS